MYLAIYGEVDRNIAFAPDSDQAKPTSSAPTTAQRQLPRIESLIAWFDRMFTDGIFARMY